MHSRSLFVVVDKYQNGFGKLNFKTCSLIIMGRFRGSGVSRNLCRGVLYSARAKNFATTPIFIDHTHQF